MKCIIIFFRNILYGSLTLILHPVKKMLFLFIFFSLVAIPALYAQDIDSILTVKDSVYTIEYQFKTTCSEKKLLEIFYEFSHLENLINKKSTSIEKLDCGESWYYVKYDYRYFFYKNISIYRKSIEPEKGLVEFKLIHFEQNLNFAPEVLDSYGFYKIIKSDTCNTVIYYQQTALKKSCSKFYLDFVKKETNFFLRQLNSYVKKFEDEVKEND
jgi:hypothetical protein